MTKNQKIIASAAVVSGITGASLVNHWREEPARHLDQKQHVYRSYMDLYIGWKMDDERKEARDYYALHY